MTTDPESVDAGAKKEPSNHSQGLVNPLQRFALTFVLVIITSLFIFNAFKMSDTGLYMPLIVGVPSLILGIVSLLYDGRRLAVAYRLRGGGHASTSRFSDENDEQDPTLDDRRPSMNERKVFTILAVLFVVFWAFGFVFATFIFVVGYMHFIGNERRSLSAVVGAGTAVFVYVFFIELLGAQVYRGYFAREILPPVLGG